MALSPSWRPERGPLGGPPPAPFAGGRGRRGRRGRLPRHRLLGRALLDLADLVAQARRRLVLLGLHRLLQLATQPEERVVLLPGLVEAAPRQAAAVLLRAVDLLE